MVDLRCSTLIASWVFLMGYQLGMYSQYVSDMVLIDNHHRIAKAMDLDSSLSSFTAQASDPIQNLPDNATLFFPFTIRDSKRLAPNQPDPEMHIFDYVDVNYQNQMGPRCKPQLFLDAKQTRESNNAYMFAPCNNYNLQCYRQKILQVFRYVLDHTNAEYFFYTEADNELCLPMSHYRKMALVEQRHFLSLGIGFSGWIMHRSFMEDFLHGYQQSAQYAPDVFGSQMLIAKKNWSVTRKYLVSHSIVPSVGYKGLTVKEGERLDKHLPRCFEPRRGIWPISGTDPRDRFGWDYFDYKACPNADFFPCRPGQLEENAIPEVKPVPYKDRHKQASKTKPKLKPKPSESTESVEVTKRGDSNPPHKRPESPRPKFVVADFGSPPGRFTDFGTIDPKQVKVTRNTSP